MKAIRINRTGGPEELSYEEISTPEPGAKEVRLKVEAAGVNFVDIYYRRGLYPQPPPFTPGMEAAGIVDSVGGEAKELEVGDHVAYAMQIGSYSEYTVVPAWKLVKLPAGVDPRSGAAVMLQGMTAHYLSSSTYALKPGDTALVHAAAGGVGQLLVQMAKFRGAQVFGVVSTQDKALLAKQAGADEVFITGEVSFEVACKRTAKEGVDVVYDSVGIDTFEKSLDCLKPRGYMVLYGQASGPVPPQDPQILNRKGSLFLTRPTLKHYARNHEEISKRTSDLFEWLETKKLRLRIDREFPLSQASEAHRYLEARKTRGKVLLIP
jgi:NADPH2:quinone reductase